MIDAAIGASDLMIVYNNQQQLTRLCSFQEDFALLQSPLLNNGNQGQQDIIYTFFRKITLCVLIRGKNDKSYVLFPKPY